MIELSIDEVLNAVATVAGQQFVQTVIAEARARQAEGRLIAETMQFGDDDDPERLAESPFDFGGMKK